MSSYVVVVVVVVVVLKYCSRLIVLTLTIIICLFGITKFRPSDDQMPQAQQSFHCGHR